MSKKMNPEQFAKGIHKSVVDDLDGSTRHLFETTDISSATDPYWIKAQGLFNKLDQADREILLSMMRQSSVDTISMMLRLLDGSARVDGQNNDAIVMLENESESLSGDLQDLFLAAEQERNPES